MTSWACVFRVNGLFKFPSVSIFSRVIILLFCFSNYICCLAYIVDVQFFLFLHFLKSVLLQNTYENLFMLPLCFIVVQLFLILFFILSKSCSWIYFYFFVLFHLIFFTAFNPTYTLRLSFLRFILWYTSVFLNV